MKFLNYSSGNRITIMKLMVCALLSILILLLQQTTYAQSQGPNSPSAGANEVVVGSNGAWTTLTNAGSSNNAYVLSATMTTNGNFTDRFIATGFGFSIPSNSSIQGITVTVEKSLTANSGSVVDNEIFLVKAGVTQTGTNKASATAWTTTDVVASYGSSSDLWGNTWTYTDINDPNFGVAVSALRNQASGAPNRAQIDHITVTVNYLTIAPVIITNFSAYKNADKNYISWTASGETNLANYSVERSDGKNNFSPIMMVLPSTSSAVTKKYEVKDNTPLSAVNYYRLVSTDVDGKKQYSPIAAVRNYKTNSDGLHLLATPAKNSLQFLAGKELNPAEPVSVALLNSSGAMILNEKIQFSSAGQIKEMVLAGRNVPPGIYVALCKQKEQQWTFKVIVQ